MGSDHAEKAGRVGAKGVGTESRDTVGSFVAIVLGLLAEIGG